MNSSGWEVHNMLLEISGEITSERMKRQSKQEQHPVVYVTGDGSQVRHCKEHYCIGTWNVRSMNQDKFSSVQLLSHVWLFATPWTSARQVSLSITNSWSPPKLMSIQSVMPSNHLILCHPLLLLPLIFPSIRVFSNESALRIRWPKYWSCSFRISPTNEHPGWSPLGSPCSPRDSQESSPTPQFKNINSSVLSFLYSPTLTSIHDHWKNHSLD